MKRLLFVVGLASLALALGGGCHAAGEVVGAQLAAALSVVARAASYVAQSDVTAHWRVGRERFVFDFLTSETSAEK